ncbi:hypothetical protein F4560_001010 [Saccharothrix ecbatanensis]|uniref:Resolvase-like protein n=1 Tax=Saccharothrix ecbatanensis TaxID=1105145 RepID=A0A7W9HFD0_9PSEU|nr:hypothetical protein [Saccharothrix ecbatanensis]MBB5801242.1 hypothetical protein [Saccharothrix ecbatanensis]
MLNDLFSRGIAVKVLEGIAAGEHVERNLILDLALAEDRRRDIVRKTRNGLDSARACGPLMPQVARLERPLLPMSGRDARRHALDQMPDATHDPHLNKPHTIRLRSARVTARCSVCGRSATPATPCSPTWRAARGLVGNRETQGGQRSAR